MSGDRWIRGLWEAGIGNRGRIGNRRIRIGNRRIRIGDGGIGIFVRQINGEMRWLDLDDGPGSRLTLGLGLGCFW